MSHQLAYQLVCQASLPNLSKEWIGQIWNGDIRKYFEVIWLVDRKLLICHQPTLEYQPQVSKCLHIPFDVPLLISNSLKLSFLHPSVASMAATASSTTVVRATPFLGQTRASNVKPLRDSVSMINGKFTMVIPSLVFSLSLSTHIQRRRFKWKTDHRL